MSAYPERKSGIHTTPRPASAPLAVSRKGQIACLAVQLARPAAAGAGGAARARARARQKNMPAILKTLPTRFARGKIQEFLSCPFAHFYFTCGLGRPQRPGIDQLYFTHQGIIIGHFDIEGIVRNEGQLPLLTTLDGNPSEWQIKPMRWVAICCPPFHPLEEEGELFHEPFRGWRYFDLAAYRGTIDARIRL